MTNKSWIRVLSSCAAWCFAAVPATAQSEPRPVIVVFQEGADLRGFAQSVRADVRAQADPQAWNYLDRGVLGSVQWLEQRHTFKADHVYSHALRGFAARLSEDQIQRLQNEVIVRYIEQDGEMHAIAQTLPWGIDKIQADVSSTLAGNGSGAITNVNAYILDTGIDTSHIDLNVAGHVSFAGFLNRDCNGHGTHVAGTVGARDDTNDVVGVAPGIRLFGVKVLSCSGNGSTSGVIKGVDWVTANAVKPAVANMSLGGGASTPLDDAVRASAASGVFYVLASGNNTTDACTTSPARAGAGTDNGILTVGATDTNDREASFSNHGACVDIWAPGVNILSTRLGGGTTVLSGTSMASPHAAGAGALYLSSQTGASPVSVEIAIKSTAVNTGNLSRDGRPIKRINVATF